MKKKNAKAQSEYDEMMAGVDPKTAIPYNMQASFGLEDVIDHPVFGLGKVVEIITPNKIRVRFPEGEKVLICVLRLEET